MVIYTYTSTQLVTYTNEGRACVWAVVWTSFIKVTDSYFYQTSTALYPLSNLKIVRQQRTTGDYYASRR